MKVCIDPGHGGKDPGAVGNGYYEKNLTLSVSLVLKKYLENNGIETVMTRESDVTLTDDLRIEKIKSSNADICLSVHFNASNGKAKGSETIYQIGNENSKKLAEIILEELGNLGLKKRRAFTKASNSNPKLDYYFILRRTRPMTAVIVECLFIDNDEDVSFLKKGEALEKLAEAIGNGVLKYFGVNNKQEHWSKPYFDHLYEIGLLHDPHSPEDVPTWGELAAMISRTIEYLSNKK